MTQKAKLTPGQLRVFEKLKQAVARGERLFFAIPRNAGKAVIAKHIKQWREAHP